MRDTLHLRLGRPLVYPEQKDRSPRTCSLGPVHQFLPPVMRPPTSAVFCQSPYRPLSSGPAYFGVRPALSVAEGWLCHRFHGSNPTIQLLPVAQSFFSSPRSHPSRLFQRFVIPISPNPNYNAYNPFVPGGTRPRSWTKRNFSSSHSPV